MFKDQYKVIGAMSGTSIDGLDLVYATITKDEPWSFEINSCKTVSYPRYWEERLHKLTQIDDQSLKRIDREYTMLLAGMISSFIDRNNFSEVDFVASHGHTALHRPDKGLTFQIGNHSFLSTYLKKTVVCDFRTQDVELGGQGAPLVPIGDHLFFSDYDYCINLGGFANISYLHNGRRIAFDICPANIVLNYYAKKMGFQFDNNGEIASKGKVNLKLLQRLNKLPYYKLNPPKSLGLEWVEMEILPLIKGFKLEIADILRTLVEHISHQIARVIQEKNKKVLITGGGAYNSYLINSLQSKINSEIIIPNNEIIEYKEALVFALLGVLKFRNEVNCLQSVTGASKDHSSGKIYQP